jgi:ribosomal protein S18 acetylase RimI-like enzyme
MEYPIYQENIKKLDWDSDFFKIRVGELKPASFNEREILKTVEKGIREDFDLIYLIIDKRIDQETIFSEFLIYRKVIFGKDLLIEKSPLPDNIIEISGGEITGKIYDLAIQSGRYSRFNIDDNIPSESFKLLYRTWIENSMENRIADRVYVYLEENQARGLITVRKDEQCGRIGIIAVDEEYRGKLIGTSLIQRVENFLISENILKLEVSTQERNQSACNFYKKNGFRIDNKINYYHIWRSDYENSL